MKELSETTDSDNQLCVQKLTLNVPRNSLNEQQFSPIHINRETEIFHETTWKKEQKHSETPETFARVLVSSSIY